MPIIASRASAAYGAGFSRVVTAAYAGPFGSYDSLASTTLSGSAASITFSGIPATYKHLQIRMSAAFTGSVGSGFIAFNDDNASSNYSFHYLVGDGGSAGASGLASQNQGKFTGSAGTTTGTPNVMVMDILDYKDTNKYKTTRAIYCNDVNGGGYVEYNSNNWRSTAAITSIVLTPANSFNTYTRVALYGVK
jgi:hypothetical protein